MEDGPSLGRKALAAAIAVGAISYLVLVVSGTITHDNRLTAAEFGLVAVAAVAIGLGVGLSQHNVDNWTDASNRCVPNCAVVPFQYLTGMQPSIRRT